MNAIGGVRRMPSRARSLATDRVSLALPARGQAPVTRRSCRCPPRRLRAEDVARLGEIEAIVECSAMPALEGAGEFVMQTNLKGAHHCLDLAAPWRVGDFLSTSRVYPVAAQDRGRPA
jgi:hypothetical protein